MFTCIKGPTIPKISVLQKIDIFFTVRTLTVKRKRPVCFNRGKFLYNTCWISGFVAHFFLFFLAGLDAVRTCGMLVKIRVPSSL